MNKILFILILSISLSTYSQQTIDQHNKRFDVIHYNLSLDIFNCFISPYVKSFKGIETIDVEATDTLTYIKLNSVNSSIEIDSVSGPINNFIDTNDTLIIFLNKIFQAGENFICTVYYKHKDTEDNAYFVKDGMVFTSNAPEGARCWFPCYDHPSDKATFELLAIVPENVFLCSNGLLIDSTMVNDTIFYHWKSDFPMATYLMNISAKRDYKLDKFYLKNPAANNDSVEIRFYWNEGEDINRLKYIEQAVQEMMNYYSEMFGKYPFRKIGFATLNDQFFYGGMENQTIINLCTDCWKEDLVAHEFAHQWFGDLITCESWADIWLNESFAEFCESLWIEHTKGNDAYKTNILKESVKYFLNNPGFPIVNKEWKFKTPPANQLYNSAVIYSKGACILDMLRYVLGDSIFFGAINYYITNDIYKYGSITTEELINLVNTYCKKDYSWFFEDWLYQPNHPVYRNEYSIIKKNKKWVTELRITQIQENAEFFRMILPIRIEYDDNTFKDYKVMNSINDEKFTFISENKPEQIIFDPNDNIILKSSTTNRID